MNPISLFVRARLTLHMTRVTGFAVAGSLLASKLGLGATLPVPCAPGACNPSNTNKTPGFASPAGFVTQGQASATVQGNSLTVTQSSQSAILNWQSFNISADGKVVFQQPSATSVALNKIYQASPSSIFGALTANGQIYLINPNGFVFGRTSTVNVAGLMASSLGLKGGDAQFATGLVPQAALFSMTVPPALESDGRMYVLDDAGQPVLDAQGNPQPVQVLVQPGAQIQAGKPGQGGRVLLVGQNVTNAGTVSAPDGQIILAAAGADPSGAVADVFLQTASSAEPWLRGLIVQVSQPGTVSNLAGGVLSAPRGNVSLIGMAVNQSGRISATTAVSANGSVTLQAALGGSSGGCPVPDLICSSQGGTLTVGPASEIDVLPELDSTATAPLGQPQIQSNIQLYGKDINIEGGAIHAPGGTLSVLAAGNPDPAFTPDGLQSLYSPDAEIRIASGTSIDLSGSDAQLPMSANLVPVQLLVNELADDPNQHNGPLHGQTVIVDIRGGRPPIISDPSWQSVVDGIQESIAQRTSVGGTASFLSQGDVVVASGATINVSGGHWTYAPGVTQTSMLIGANGQLYNIATADPSLTYTGVLNPTYTQSYPGFGVLITLPTPGMGHYESGYVQGFSAGTLQFAAPSMAIQGTLTGTAVNGPYQRSNATIPPESFASFYAAANQCASATGTCPASSAPGAPQVTVPAMAMGGTLILGDPLAQQVSGGVQFFAPAVTFAANAPPVVVAPGTPLPVQTMLLPEAYLTSGGFSRTEIFSDSIVSVPQGLPLNLGPGGSLQIEAPRIVVDSDITAPGGSIALTSEQSAFYPSSGLPRTGIDIGAGVTLDVRGQWTNNSIHAPAASMAPTYQNGGSIALSRYDPYSLDPSGEIVLGDGVSLQASGGAWLQASNTVVGGAGGSITIAAQTPESALKIGNNVTLDAFGVQGAPGGHFSLSAPEILISPGDGTWAAAQQVDELSTPGQAVSLGAALFSQYGFSSVSLTATGFVPVSRASTDVLTVAAGTAITAQAQEWVLAPNFPFRASGGEVQGFVQAQLPPPAYQSPESVTLAALPLPGLPEATLGDLDVQAGASLVMAPNALSKITLAGMGSILVEGTLRAPGGSISMAIGPPSFLNSADPGFLQAQTLTLGPQAVIDVGGAAVLTPNRQNLPLGTVLPGGTVSLITARGALIADAGSVIDIAGGSALLDVPLIAGSGGYRQETVGSTGGSLSVASSESISLRGNLVAAAGVNSTGPLAAGSLVVDLDQSLFGGSDSPTTPLPPSTPTIELVSSTAGSAPSAAYGATAVLGIAQLEQSGIDSLTLRAGNPQRTGGVIALDSNTPLSLGRQITLDAQNISVGYGTSAELDAPYVALTDILQAQSLSYAAAGSAVGGTGSLTVNAGQIVLGGNTALQGAGRLSLNSTGDVEFEPVGGLLFSGSLAVAGDLSISAALVYPATQTAYTILDPTGTVTIAHPPGGSSSTQVPLSVNGTIAINAQSIVSSGTIRAPFGQIALNATSSLSLQDGSVTSVSADGLILPYGQTTLGGQQWIYLQAGQPTPLTGTPLRQVSLTAPNIAFSKGATIDVSGGGDLSAYEWVPGPHGSVDSLSPQNAAASNLYAIIPGMGASYAAYDAQEFAGSNVSPGESVYLTAGSGVPAGYYTLLPARYGLLPGAYLVQLEPGITSIQPGVIGGLNDGTPVVAGHLGFGTTGLQSSSGYVGFAVRPGSYIPSLAQYNIASASSFFATASASPGSPAAVLPADAGTLLIQSFPVSTPASSSLPSPTMDLQGTVMAQGYKKGTGAIIDISSPSLTVNASGAPGSNGVTLGASVLESWDAGDLVLGGQLLPDGNIAVTAASVSIDSGTVAAGEVFVVADQSIAVGSGAKVASTSGLAGPAPAHVSSTTLGLVQQQAAGSGSTEIPDTTAGLLAVSDTTIPFLSQAGASGASISVSGTLSTRGAVALYAPGSLTVGGTIDALGAAWSLGAGSIAFVSAGGAPAGVQGSPALLIGPGLLSQMQQAGSLQLSSAGDIDFWTPMALGASSNSSAATPTLASLTLSAAQLNSCAVGACNPVTLGGQVLTLNGVSPTAGTPSAGTGTLNLLAGTFEVTGTNLAISGNQQTQIVSATVITAANGLNPALGSGVLGIAGDLDIKADVLTAASLSATTLAATGSLSIEALHAAPAASTLTGSLGGHVAFSAASITDSGSIIVPGGTISLAATGSATFGSGAVLSTAGITVSAGDRTAGAAGGNVSITAGGALVLAAGSLIDVSSPAVPGLVASGSSPAGSVSLSGGSVILEGMLAGKSGGGGTGGSFSLYAGTLSGGLAPLASSLRDFTDQIGIEVGSGDLYLPGGAALTANRITLAADTGSIDIGGVLSAPSAGLRGSIGLYAGNNVGLESGGALLAGGTTSNGAGGEIELSSTRGSILLNGGRIAAAGAGGGPNGTLLLRAPAVLQGGTYTGVAIGSVGADLSAVGQLIIEPVLTVAPPATGSIDQSYFSQQVLPLVASYLGQGSSVIPGGFPVGPGQHLLLEPGVEIDAPGNLTVSQALDLNQMRVAGQLGAPIDLTVRAAGNLTIAGSVSDGVAGDDGTLGSPITLSSAPSSSLRFIAGANLGSANALAVVPSAATSSPPGVLTLAPGAIVRTGTGDIDLVAAGDVVFGKGSSAYTTGMAYAPAQSVSARNANLTVNFPTVLETIQPDGSVVPCASAPCSVVAGGNVVVDAGGNVQGQAAQSSVSNWQLRTLSNGLGQWGLDLGAFDQTPFDLATFGGGDLSITAGHSVLNVSAAAADSMLVSGTGAQAHLVSGALAVTAGQDITSGQFSVADGLGTLAAGGSFATGLRGSGTTPVGSVFELESGSLSLWAQRSITIEGVFNPTASYEPVFGHFGGPLQQVGFYTYGANSAFSAQSSGGDVTAGPSSENTNALAALLGSYFAHSSYISQAPGTGLNIYPGTLSLTALEQDLVLKLITLYPSANGQLTLFAGRDITGGNGGVTLSDVTTNVPTASSPTAGVRPGMALVENVVPQQGFFYSTLHAGDQVPASIVAGRTIGGTQAPSFQIPKAADIEAGLDIDNVVYSGENLGPNDLTLLSAGRNITLPTRGVRVGGPGRLDLIAGGSIDLGVSNGVLTTGNLSNGSLAPQGASITMMAGLGQEPDYSGFYKTIIQPSKIYSQQLVSYVEQLNGQSGLSMDQAETDFLKLAPDQQRPFIDQVFFSELNQSGLDYNKDPTSNFKQGYTAIDALFPGSRGGRNRGRNGPYQGNLSLTYSEIYTQQGGGISLLVPGGEIDVGLASAPTNVAPKPPYQLGIVAEGPGDIDIYSFGDVSVNSSRIFTLGGGSILIWSDRGSIDAGLGAKVSLSIPPPTVVYNSQGIPFLNFSGAVAGSGIRTIQDTPGAAAGDVNLVAPAGTINAGDAGIAAARNINTAALVVLNVANISYGGTATGVPSLVSNLAGSLAGAAATASSAGLSPSASLENPARRQEAAPLASSAIGWLDVFVTGLGEENCKPEDLECLKRQKQ
jgi:filamentous hemagglutinin family protein